MSHRHNLTKKPTYGLLLLPLLAFAWWGFFKPEANVSAFDGIMPAQILDEDHLKVGISGTPDMLDPASNLNINSALLIKQIYDTLTEFSAGDSIAEPGLADSWSVSPDGMVWTFNLRSGVTFHDGTPLDSAAVVYNIERWWDPDHPYHPEDFTFFQYFFGGFRGSQDSLLAGVISLSDLVVELRLTRANSLIPQLLAYPGFSIASPAAIQSGNLNELPIGSGAYCLQAQDTNSFSLSSFDGYWGRAPQISGLEFVVIEDPLERLATVVDGTTQVALNLDEEALSVALNPDLQIIWRESNGIGYLGFNQSHPILGDHGVRKAIAHAVNLSEIVNSFYTYGDQVASQLVPPAIWGHNPSLDSYIYDPALAKDLLASAGYPEGFNITLSYRNVFRTYLPDLAGIAAALRDDLETVGITLNIQEIEDEEFISKFNSGELDLFLLGWYADYPHANNFYNIICQYRAESFGPQDDEFCNSLESASAEFDLQEQLNLYYSLGQQMNDDIPLLPIAYPREAVVLHTSLAGFVPSLMRVDQFKDIYYSGAIQEAITPENISTLTFSQTNGNLITVEVQQGAVSDTLLLRLEPSTASSLPVERESVGQAFTLIAIQDGEEVSNFNFEQPIRVNIEYTDDGIWLLDESSLALYYWDGEAWVPAALSCQPPGETNLDQEANSLVTEICHLSHFALLADRYSLLYIPALGK
jgi:peptide/nickel transport system substrate-binding protein